MERAEEDKERILEKVHCNEKKVARTKNYPSFSGGCEVGWAGVSVMSIVTRNVC